MHLIGKDLLCSSPRSLICDEQGVGKYPLWQRYDSLYSIIQKHIPILYHNFLAQPERVLSGGEDELYWYGPHAVSSTPSVLSELSGPEREKYMRIKDETLSAYFSAIDKCKSQGDASDAEHLEKSLKHVGEYDEYFFCYDDRVVVVVWGMRPRDVSSPSRAIVNKLILPNITYVARFDLAGLGNSNSSLEVRKRPQDSPIQSTQVPMVVPIDGYRFLGWSENPVGFKLMSDKVFVAQYEKLSEPTPIYHCVRFEDENGNLISQCEVEHGKILPSSAIPPIPTREHYKCSGWGNSVDNPIENDATFRLSYEQLSVHNLVYHIVSFEDENGNLLGQCEVEHGKILPSTSIPPMPTREHYKCNGWGEGVYQPINNDTTFRLSYERLPLTWWERICMWFENLKKWFHESGRLKWLLRLLLFLLLLILLLFLLRNCRGCSRKHVAPNPIDWTENPIFPNYPDDPATRGDFSGNLPYEPVDPDAPGFEYLPEKPSTPIPIDDGDVIPGDDSLRNIVKDRLNVLIDADDISITDFAYDFKQAYASDAYQIIYADPIVKRLQLKVPSAERVQIKNELVSKLPEKYQGDKIFVWDEALMAGSFTSNDDKLSSCWFHYAINTFSAWDITMGSEDIIIAIVDDGFNVNHEEFKDHTLTPYNVFTKSNSVRESRAKHGTHVAGLATASADNRVGIAGVAPKCKLLPIQVFDDNGICSTMSTVDGILYAIYKGADVVNLSLGLNLTSDIPLPQQQELIRSYFKEEERLWKKVFSMANRNKTAIVIAAGNESLLAGIDPMHRSDDVIVVAAVDRENAPLKKSDFSNYGSYTDVSAPGRDILSTVRRNNYEFMSGTSMAAPIVTGAVALIKSVNRPLSTSQIRKILQETGIPVQGNVGPLIQLDKALRRAQNENPDCGDNIPTPTQGALQVLLEWNDYNDLDLICEDPFGDRVWYKQKTIPSGGQLEIDMNAGGRSSSHPIENIYWPEGGAPEGSYKIKVLYYKRHDTHAESSDFKVTVRYADQELHYQGTASEQGASYNVGSFTFSK